MVDLESIENELASKCSVCGGDGVLYRYSAYKAADWCLKCCGTGLEKTVCTTEELEKRFGLDKKDKLK